MKMVFCNIKISSFLLKCASQIPPYCLLLHSTFIFSRGGSFMFSLLTRAALLCAAAALLAPARAAEIPELDPDTHPMCKELAHSCVTELDADKLQTKLMPYATDIIMGTNKEATRNEVRSTLTEVFETCMDGANSCCCCDENMKTAIE